MGMMKGYIFVWLENLPDISMMDGDCPSAEEYWGTK